MKSRTVSITFDGLSPADCLDDHHSRDGEWMIGIHPEPIESMEDLQAAIMTELNACAREDDFPWAAIKAELPHFLEGENLLAFQQDYRDCERSKDSESQWWFVITEDIEDN